MNEKKYALVTGATGGLGKALAKALCDEGYDLLLSGRSEEKLNNFKEELQEIYPARELRIYPAN